MPRAKAGELRQLSAGLSGFDDEATKVQEKKPSRERASDAPKPRASKSLTQFRVSLPQNTSLAESLMAEVDRINELVGSETAKPSSIWLNFVKENDAELTAIFADYLKSR